MGMLAHKINAEEKKIKSLKSFWETSANKIY